jgi:hypothetical protein
MTPALITKLKDMQRVLKLTGDSPAVKARQRIEQTIALVAAQALLDAGYSLGVNDGEESTITHSRDIGAVQKALFTTDEDYLYGYEAGRTANEKDKRPDVWIRLVYGNDGWDVISDYAGANTLDPIIGDGTAVGKLVEHASTFGTVPELFSYTIAKR